MSERSEYEMQSNILVNKAVDNVLYDLKKVLPPLFTFDIVTTELVEEEKMNHKIDAALIPVHGFDNKIISYIKVKKQLNVSVRDVLTALNAHLSEDTEDKKMLNTIKRMESLSEDDMSVDDKIRHAISRIVADRVIPSPERNKEIIRILYEQNVFQLKDSATRVAELMHISKNTVYLHLRNIKNGK